MVYNDFMNERVSALGLGAMRLPLKDAGDLSSIDKEETRRMVSFALENGINYFDTAYVYHNGLSEGAIAEALQGYERGKYFLADKFFIQADTDYKKVFNTQLSRLKTSYIDNYLIHSIQDGNIDSYIESGCIEFFSRMKEEGKIKHLGFSFHSSIDNLNKFIKVYDWDFAQIQLNYFDYYNINTLSNKRKEYEILTEKKIPLIIMEPLRGGSLSSFDSLNNSEVNAVISKMNKLHPDWSLSSWALRWLFRFSNIKLILSGMSCLMQVKDNVKTFQTKKVLTKEEEDLLLELLDQYKNSVVVPCTSCRYCTKTCPAALDIPTLLNLFNLYSALLDWQKGEAIKKLRALPKERSSLSCLDCGECAKLCPQHIDIPGVMKKITKLIK